ncbi:MAG: magnesium transporter [Eubacteriales bacterium]|nr:magnesium transporter [Eubacteriales bacterium]
MLEKTLELLEDRNYSELRAFLMEFNPADIALLLGEVPESSILLIFRILPKELAAESFAYMDSDLQEILIRSFNDSELHYVIDQLYIDDTVDIIEEMPANVVKRILRHTDPETRRKINELLQYPADSAGSIMTIEFIDLKKNMTVADAFARIRKIGIDKETIYTCYMTDRDRHLLGIVTVKDLLLNDESALLGDIMETKVISVHTHDDQESVANMFNKYGFLALPVVDKENRLVGIITVDDAMEVFAEEASEDFAMMSAIAPTDDGYFKTSVFQHAKNRIVWLLFLMLSATLTGAILTKYEVVFSAIPLLVSFIPQLMSTGGNTGTQSSTTVIRGLATEEINTKDIFKVLRKELCIASLLGIVLAIVNSIRIVIMYQNVHIGNNSIYMIAFVTGITIIGTIMASELLGCLLPVIAKKLKLDPAIMASPVITTIVDACSVLLYFTIAGAFLNVPGIG